MKKTLAAILAILLTAAFCAAEEPKVTTEVSVSGTAKVTTTTTEYTVYDVIGHEDLASNVLLGWGVCSVAAGSVMMQNENVATRAFGTQNVFWGALETAASIWLKTALDSKKKNDPAEEAKWFRDTLGWGFLANAGIMAIGGAMVAWGNDEVRGFGTGALCQGAFMFMFDGINWAVSNNLGNRYKDPEQEDKGVE